MTGAVTGGLDALQGALAQGAWFAFPLALLGGLAVGLNPCCLAMVPAMTATCCGHTCGEEPKSALKGALALVAGMATATTVMGLVAAALGRSLLVLPPLLRVGLGFVPLAMGIHLLGWLRIPMPSWASPSRGQGWAATYLAGLLLALIMGTCGTPVLLALLSYTAVQGHVLRGGMLMLLYGLGSGLPMLLAGTLAAGLARTWLQGSRQRVLEQITGGSLLVLGYYLIWTMT